MDKIFRQKLESLAEEPPAYVWEKIQEKLALRSGRRRLARYGWPAAAAMLAIAFIAGWYLRERTETSIQKVTETEITRPENDLVFTEKKVTPPENEKTGELLQSRPAIHFPEPAIIRPSALDTEDDELIARVNMEYIRPLPVVMNIRNRFEALRVDPSGHISPASSPEGSGEEKSLSGLFGRERDIVDYNARELIRAKNDKGKWKMGLSISPGYSSYHASHASVYASNMTYKSSDGDGNLSGGISVQYNTGGRWSIESGVYYAQNGQQTNSSPQLFGGRMESDYSSGISADKLYFNTIVTMTDHTIALNSTAGIIEFESLPKGAEIAANLEGNGMYSSSLMIRGEFSQVFDFVEIPLYLRYLLIDSKIDMELIGGINAGLVAGNNAFIDNEFGIQNIGKTRDISTVNVSGTIGFGMNYAFGSHFSLAVEPRMNYYLNSINRNPDVEFRPFRVGVYTGLYYAF